MDEMLYRALTERAAGRCEACDGTAAGFMHAHHRRLRSRGGKDELTNLLFMHDACHRWAHDNPKDATGLGWIVSGYGPPPAEVRVVRRSLRRNGKPTTSEGSRDV